MKLDRDTYEAWLLDRLEGNLTPAQERELTAFLAANPDLEAGSDGLPAIATGAPEIIDWKDELKKRLPPIGMPDAARLNEFLVARVEGDLDAAQQAALEKFLYEHPEFEQDAKRVAASRVEPTALTFADKPSIERHFPPQGLPDKHRLTDFLIAAEEGDLDQDQQRALDAFLAGDPAARLQQRLIVASKVPAEHVVFSGKKGLKKQETRVIALWQRYAVAASIALLLGFAWWMSRTPAGAGPALAEQDDHRAAPVPPVKAPEEHGSSATGPEGSNVEPIAPHNAPATVHPDKRIRPSAPPQDEHGQRAPAPEDEGGRAPDAPVAPVPAPAQDPRPVEPLPVPEPQLARAPEPAEQDPSIGAASEPAEMAAVDHRDPGGTPLGTVLANSVRDGVLATDKRGSGLDGDDALAMANRALGAVTGGKGGVEVAPTSGRSRWKLRLGQHLAISASTGR